MTAPHCFDLSVRFATTECRCPGHTVTRVRIVSAGVDARVITFTFSKKIPSKSSNSSNDQSHATPTLGGGRARGRGRGRGRGRSGWWPTERYDTTAMLEWLWGHFAKPRAQFPCFLQHSGHSRTVVGTWWLRRNS